MRVADHASRTAVEALAALLILLSSDVMACRCPGPETPAEAFSLATLVFTGTVVELSKTVAIRVEERFKGSVPERVAVESPAPSCRYPFERARQYLVYAREVEGKVVTTICERTSPLAWAVRELSLLRKYRDRLPRSERWYE
ncbi:MAG: hypothetical protein HY791_05460 [Deltaproteobacteria bacterium]|nr:hypothetical protein [Deltaproteobacteria bacterium]